MTKILCVDDSAVMRKMVIHTLEGAGFTCCEAEDGVQGLEVLKKESPDLVITDYNMPNMNGLDYLAEIRKLEKFKYMPVLLLSTESAEELRNIAKGRGATGWIVKPFNPEKLIRVINKVLGE